LLAGSGRDFRTVEAGDRPGSLFAAFRRHRRLISINKRFTGSQDPELVLPLIAAALRLQSTIQRQSVPSEPVVESTGSGHSGHVLPLFSALTEPQWVQPSFQSTAICHAHEGKLSPRWGPGGMSCIQLIAGDLL
jgi:hypothetical protein